MHRIYKEKMINCQSNDAHNTEHLYTKQWNSTISLYTTHKPTKTDLDSIIGLETTNILNENTGKATWLVLELILQILFPKEQALQNKNK